MDGSLPDPSPEWEATGQWIAPYQWDMIIYMWSNAEIRKTSTSFSGRNAAYGWCGLNRDTRDKVEMARRRDDLFVGLERAGLLRHLRDSPGGRRTYRELLLAPTWAVDGIIPCDMRRSWENLRVDGRQWFKMPFLALSGEVTVGKRKLRRWAALEHSEKRALTALYHFFDERTFGAVDPNHLRLEQDMLCMSGEFAAACGAPDDPDAARVALGALWRKGLFDWETAAVECAGVFPAAPSHIRSSRSAPAARTDGHAIACPKYVPEPSDPNDDSD